MVNITIEGTDYDTDNMTDEQKELIEVLRINTTTSNLVGHMLQCVNAIGRVKVDELRASLSDGKKTKARRRHNSRRYRSGLEETLAEYLTHHQKEVRYELLKVQWEDLRYRTYTPDFQLDNGIICEAKGLFDNEDRRKHLAIQKQHPELDIRFVFSNAQAKLYKGSKTRYSGWCEKHGFKWAHRVIPLEWLTEKGRYTKATVIKLKTKKKGYLVAYELADDEVALILRPINFDEDGVWSGLISTGLAMGPESNIDKAILSDLIKCATFLSAFLDIAHDYPNIMEVVEKRRDEVIKMFEQDAEEEANGLPEVEIQTSGGKVIKFGPTTKTKGSA